VGPQEDGRGGAPEMGGSLRERLRHCLLGQGGCGWEGWSASLGAAPSTISTAPATTPGSSTPERNQKWVAGQAHSSGELIGDFFPPGNGSVGNLDLRYQRHPRVFLGKDRVGRA
jgi:hypothetical protein